METEVWVKAYCPSCSASNWVEDDPDEPAEGFICYKCKRHWLFEQPEEPLHPIEQPSFPSLSKGTKAPPIS